VQGAGVGGGSADVAEEGVRLADGLGERPAQRVEDRNGEEDGNGEERGVSCALEAARGGRRSPYRRGRHIRQA
jgi:hypothetical protein